MLTDSIKQELTERLTSDFWKSRLTGRVEYIGAVALLESRKGTTIRWHYHSRQHKWKLGVTFHCSIERSIIWEETHNGGAR